MIKELSEYEIDDNEENSPSPRLHIINPNSKDERFSFPELENPFQRQDSKSLSDNGIVEYIEETK